ncbi:MAG: Bug family tripartite tricarboxylate transporter substrate binding protein [Lautropia sp.]
MNAFVMAAGALVLASAMSMHAPAMAQEFPVRPIRLVVGWPAGGTADGVARTLAPALSEALGQPVVVENKPGASGSIGAAEVAAAKPDGHTLGIVFDTQAVNHHLYRTLRYDPFKSFVYLSRLVTAPQILVAANAFPAGDAAGLIRHARANPGKVTYASTGAGSSNHLNALLFASQAGIELAHVPYKGGVPALTDLGGGQVDIMIVSAPSTMPTVRAGRIKVLAVGSAAPLPQVPGVQPIAATLPGFEASSWIGLIAPAGLPQPVLARLEREVRTALARKDVAEKLTGAGYEIVASTSEAFGAFMRRESDKWEQIIRTYKVAVE